MGRALASGAVYFAAVFALGFVLGVVRTLALAPRIGELAAVAVELPLILAASWWICGRTIRSLGVSGSSSERIAMGATAFALLMTAEAALAMLVLGRSPSAYFEALSGRAGLLGLLGQLAFAAFPIIQRRAP